MEKHFIANNFVQKKYNIHVHEKDDVTTYKGVQMPATEEDKSIRFIKLFPCIKCDTKSRGIEKHKQHISAVHDDIEYSLACVYNKCEFKTSNPKALMEHLGTMHQIL